MTDQFCINNINLCNLVTLYNNYIEELNTEISNQLSGNPKPSYSVGNRSVSWDDYRTSMMSNIREAGQQINDMLLLISKYNTFDLYQSAQLPKTWNNFI